MGGLCVMLLMFFCVSWILVAYIATILTPLVVVYNGIASVVCFCVYFILRSKDVFKKYTEGYKHVLSMILKYGLLLYGISSASICIILGFLWFG